MISPSKQLTRRKARSADFPRGGQVSDRVIWLALATIYFTLNCTEASGALLLTGKALLPLIYGGQAIVVFIFAVKSLLKRNYVTLAISVTVILYGIFEIFLFCNYSKTEFSLKDEYYFVSFCSILIFIDFRNDFKSIAKCLFVVCIAYCAFYLFANMFLLNLFVVKERANDAIASGANFKLVGKSHDADLRIPMSTPYIAYAVFYAIFNIRKPLQINMLANNLTFLGIIGACAIAFRLSDYRFATILLALTLTLYYISRYFKYALHMALAIFVIAICASGFGCIDPNFNPFSHFTNPALDYSGWARFNEYEAAKTVFFEHPIFGVGYSRDQFSLDAIFLARVNYFYSDIGVMGVMSMFGIIGGILFLAIGSGCILFGVRMIKSVDLPNNALIVIGIFVAAYGSYWTGSGTLFAMLCLTSLASSFKFAKTPHKIRKRPPLRKIPT